MADVNNINFDTKMPQLKLTQTSIDVRQLSNSLPYEICHNICCVDPRLPKYVRTVPFLSGRV